MRIPFSGTVVDGKVSQLGGPMLTIEELAAIRRRVEELRLEHGDLEAAISALGDRPFTDEIQMRRLKKRKLQLKDMIAKLESNLIPDLDA